MKSYKLLSFIFLISLVSIIFGVNYLQQQKISLPFFPKIEQTENISIIEPLKATELFKHLTGSLDNSDDYKKLEEKIVDFRLGFILLQKSYLDKKISQQDYQVMADKYLKYYYEYLVNNGKKTFLEQINIRSDSDFTKSFYKNVINFQYSEADLLKNIWGDEMKLIFSPFDVNSIKKVLGQYKEEEIKKAYNFVDISGLERNLDLHIFYNAKINSDCNTITGDREKKTCDAYYK